LGRLQWGRCRFCRSRRAAERTEIENFIQCLREDNVSILQPFDAEQTVILVSVRVKPPRHVRRSTVSLSPATASPSHRLLAIKTTARLTGVGSLQQQPVRDIR
jgi:hypothetical protein